MKKEVIGGKGCVTYLPNQIYFHGDTFPTGPGRAWRGGVNTDENVEAKCHLGFIRMDRVVVDEFQHMTGLFLSQF